MIESKANFIEHPELIAQRIMRYAKLVGRENVMAGSDCGYGTWVGQAAVDPDVVWAKLAALRRGRRAGLARALASLTTPLAHRRAGHQRLELAEAELARQVLHPAVGRREELLGRLVRTRGGCARPRPPGSRPPASRAR